MSDIAINHLWWSVHNHLWENLLLLGAAFIGWPWLRNKAEQIAGQLGEFLAYVLLGGLIVFTLQNVNELVELYIKWWRSS